MSKVSKFVKRYMAELGIGGGAGALIAGGTAKYKGEDRVGSAVSALGGLGLGVAAVGAPSLLLRMHRAGKAVARIPKSTTYTARADTIVNHQDRVTNLKKMLDEKKYESVMDDLLHKEMKAQAWSQKPIMSPTDFTDLNRKLRSAKTTLATYNADMTAARGTKDFQKLHAIQINKRNLLHMEGEWKNIHDAVRNQYGGIKVSKNKALSMIDKLKQEQQEYVEKMKQQLEKDIYGSWFGMGKASI
jgi:hypothetical protein